jgi:nucleoside-diphosphate-sugar epimerase
MKVLVTGASGTFGPFVVRELERAGHEVVTMSRREPAASVRHVPWVRGDITVYEDCERALAGEFGAIQHVAAQASPTDHPAMRAQAEKRGIPFDATMRTNIMGLYNLLQAALAKGVGIFVMTGSNCALGHGFRISDRKFPFRYLPVDEHHPSDVEDSYSYAKLAGEELLASYTRAYGIRTYAVRAAGICDAERRAAMRAAAGAAGGWDTWLWAWVGSEDVATAQRLLMEQAATIAPHGAFFCNGDDTTAVEPTRELVERFRPDLVPLLREVRGHQSLISNQALKDAVGWGPATSWRSAP